jgi:hypothetical protein
MGLRRRVKFAKPWLIDEKYDPEASVFLDSGAYTVNTDDGKYSEDDLRAISLQYQEFVASNIGRVDMVSEFDAIPLGQNWIEKQREDFYNTLPADKFMVVWHPEWGLDYLNALAERYRIIGIPSTSLDGRNLAPFLNALAAKGTRLHGVAMTKIDIMQSIRWETVASTSWISPQQFGDTIVFTGRELKRYPKKYKEQARKRHRTLFNNNGFDADKIANDDPTEVLRLSVWSFQQFEEYVNKHHRTGSGVTTPFSHADPPKAETEEDEVDTPLEKEGKNLPTVVTPRGTELLPIMAITSSKSDDDDDEEEGVPLINNRSDSARVCDSCFLAERCPGYEAGSNCAYNIPITVRTREQLRALRYGMLEMQTQRVFFMRFAEDVSGGYADPNLSAELRLLDTMIKDTEHMEQEGFDVSLRIKGSGQAAEAGMISRIFGRDTGVQVQELEAGGVLADDIMEGQIVEEIERANE